MVRSTRVWGGYKTLGEEERESKTAARKESTYIHNAFLPPRDYKVTINLKPET
jgi:hypothetical protein